MSCCCLGQILLRRHTRLYANLTWNWNGVQMSRKLIADQVRNLGLDLSDISQRLTNERSGKGYKSCVAAAVSKSRNP